MFSLDLESRILEKAREKGLLKEASREELDPARLLDPFSIQASSMWGPRLDDLVKAGRIAQNDVAALAFDLLQSDPGSEDSWTSSHSEGLPELTLPAFGTRYETLSLLAEGATSHVYRAFDSVLQRWVALKFLKALPGSRANEALVEARAQAQVEHPNVCRIYEVGETDGRGFIAMQLVEGESLAKTFRELDQNTKIRLIRDIAEGVHAAHRKGLVHLDLKPGNILVQKLENGELHPLLTDFGMMRSETSPLAGPCPMGTPPYSSPEQITGDLSKVDRRSDVYSLGVLLYVLLTQTFPFEAETFSELLDAIRNRRPLPLLKRLDKASEDLGAILDCCFKKDPTQRYDSAQALADDLQRFLDGLPVQAIKRNWRYLLVSMIRRNRKLSWSLVGASVALALAVGIGIHQVRFAQEEGRWASQFEQDVNQLETPLAQAYAQPAHDSQSEETQVRATLKRIDEEMAAGGKPAAGPGHYAKARIHHLLRDNLLSWEELDQAWATGLRTPPLVVAYAESLIERFQDESDGVAGFKPNTRRKWITPLQNRYLVPASKLLMQARGHIKDSLRTRVDIALAEAANDYPRAIEIARTDRIAHPTDYRAYRTETLLRGKYIYFLGADSNAFPSQTALWGLGGSPAEQRKAFETTLEEALKAHDQLTTHFLEIAPSDPLAWRRRLECLLTLHAFHPPKGDDLIRARVQIQDFRERALQLFPNDTTLMSGKAAWIFDVQVPELIRIGEDPLPLAQEAMAINLRAAKMISPTEPDLIWAYTRADWITDLEILSGKANLKALEASVRETAKLYPLVRVSQRPAAADSMYYCVYSLLNYTWDMGEDPSEFVHLQFQLLTDLEHVEPYNGAFSALYLTQAQWAIAEGKDPWPYLNHAETRVHTLLTSQDPAINPPWSVRLGHRCRLISLQGLAAGPGKANLDAFQDAEREIQSFLAKGGQNEWEIYSLKMRLGYLHFVWAQVAPTSDLAKTHCNLARKAYEDALAISLVPTSIHDRLAELALLESRYFDAPEVHLKQGLDETVRALEYPLLPSRKPRRPGTPLPPLGYESAHQGFTYRLRGELELELAKREHDPAHRQATLERSRLALDEALRLNRNLQHQVTPLLAQMDALSSTSHHSQRP
jgi:serine/threonine protein kinase